ncbi:MAG TPA: DUF3800 domain-containing protein [Ktedonobacteraceae bacterium]|nr:DUF3800 domain-containing protein [Ktedonobacteraceae bacterium]
MSIIFLDESGFTGQDLLNIDQPVFTLATIHCSERQCEEFKSTFFQDVRSTELKHSRLVRSPRYQRKVLEFFHELSKTPEIVKISITHKRYVLTAKIVELLVDPAAYQDGLDLNANGAAFELTNLLYTVLPVLCGKEFFNDLLHRFQKMIRNLNHQSYIDFFVPLFIEEFPENIDTLLTFLRAYHINLGYDKLVDQLAGGKQFGINSGYLDIGLSCTLDLLAMWRGDILGNITLIHDASSRMAQELNIWNALVDPTLPAAVFEDAYRKLVFPVALDATRLEDSKDWIGLQLADVLAGATSYWAKWIIEGKAVNDEYGGYLDAILPQFLAEIIWPSAPATTDEELITRGTNASASNDYFSSVLLHKYMSKE